jgi:hypothetical protein
VTAFVPPQTASDCASFVLSDFEEGAWLSRASGCWLIPENPDLPSVIAGSLVVVTAGPRPIAFFTVDDDVLD